MGMWEGWVNPTPSAHTFLSHSKAFHLKSAISERDSVMLMIYYMLNINCHYFNKK